MRKKLLIVYLVNIIFLTVFSMGIVSASLNPHVFYGDVKCSSGQDVQTGTIIAKIEGEIVETGEIVDGKYGYGEPFMIYGKDCDIIYFYISGKDDSIGNYMFMSFKVTKLDFIIDCEELPGPCGDGIIDIEEECDNGEFNGILCDNSTSSCIYCSSECELITLPYSPPESRGHYHSARTHFVQYCEPYWQCSGWSECSNGAMTRQCQDVNMCDFVYNKPIEATGCEEGVMRKVLAEDKKINLWLLILLLGIALVLFLIIVVALVRRR